MTPSIDVEIDFHALAASFPSRPMRAETTRALSAAAADNRVRLLGLQRANVVGAFLRRLRLPLRKIRSAVLGLPRQSEAAAQLGVEHVTGLLHCLPKDDEVKLLTGYKGDREMLGDVEQFMMEVRVGGHQGLC